MSHCATENTLVDFLEGKIQKLKSHELQKHIAHCADCHSLLVEIAAAFSFHGNANSLLQPSSGADKFSASGMSDFLPPPQIEEYQVLGPIGKGAMGQVFLGHDTQLDRPVAIKFLTAIETDARARERLWIEARAIARLQHPNVVAIYRVGEVAGHPFLVSEFVCGQSLDKLAKPVSWQRALTIGVGLAKGLAAAHQRGVLHRDVKPANAVLTEDGNIKLLDFGLAKLMEVSPSAESVQWAPPIVWELAGPCRAATGQTAPLGADADRLTDTGLLIGTPRYMAPEIWRGERASPASDVYSLGTLLYELCTGHVPHHGVIQLRDLRQLALEKDLPSLRMEVAVMNPQFSALVARCLCRNPAERFASGEEVRVAMEQILALLPIATGGYPSPVGLPV